MGELVARGVGIEQFKQELVAAIKHKAKWRSERAGQYRSDRNARSAAALEALARALDAMPTNHPRILRVWALKQWHCGPESLFAEQDVLQTYGSIARKMTVIPSASSTICATRSISRLGLNEGRWARSESRDPRARSRCGMRINSETRARSRLGAPSSKSGREAPQEDSPSTR